MKALTLLQEIVHSPVLDIILLLKKSDGLSVKELCVPMKMSYMGVKQHLMELEKKRLVETGRRPKPTGRPEKIYRVGRRLDPLFPERGNRWTLALLETADQVFGERGAEKLLFSLAQQRQMQWQRALQGLDFGARVRGLVRFRLEEGFLTVARPVEGAVELVDCHDPCGEVAAQYPLVRELDRECVEAAMGVPVRCSVEESGSGRRVIFHIPAPTDEAGHVTEA
jgi:predicted ArsR family transcriptional regulator